MTQLTRIEEDIAQHSNHVECKEHIEVAEANRVQGLRCKLSKDEVECPVGECGCCVSESSDLDWENLSWVYPGDDTKRGVEEGEDKVHGDHGTKHVSVSRIQVLRHGGIADQSGSKTESGDDEGLDTTESLQCPEADTAIHDGQGSTDTDNHERSRVADTKDLVNFRT